MRASTRGRARARGMGRERMRAPRLLVRLVRCQGGIEIPLPMSVFGFQFFNVGRTGREPVPRVGEEMFEQRADPTHATPAHCRKPRSGASGRRPSDQLVHASARAKVVFTELELSVAGQRRKAQPDASGSGETDSRRERYSSSPRNSEALPAWLQTARCFAATRNTRSPRRSVSRRRARRAALFGAHARAGVRVRQDDLRARRRLDQLVRRAPRGYAAARPVACAAGGHARHRRVVRTSLQRRSDLDDDPSPDR